MNVELKAQWLKDLRSKKFKQGRGLLRYEDGDGGQSWCCLGVLVESASAIGISLEGRNNSFLTRKHLAMAGLLHGQQRDLADMNDDGKRFAEIADYIEKEL